jgi:hypothetical protein
MSEGSPDVLYGVEMTKEVVDLMERTAEDLTAINPKFTAIGYIIGHPIENGGYGIAIIPVGEHRPKALGEILIKLGVELLKGPAVSGEGTVQ